MDTAKRSRPLPPIPFYTAVCPPCKKTIYHRVCPDCCRRIFPAGRSHSGLKSMGCCSGLALSISGFFISSGRTCRPMSDRPPVHTRNRVGAHRHTLLHNRHNPNDRCLFDRNNTPIRSRRIGHRRNQPRPAPSVGYETRYRPRQSIRYRTETRPA